MSKAIRVITRDEAPDIVARFLNQAELTLPYHICGSYRRGKQEFNDLDLVLVCNSLADHQTVEAGLVCLFGRQVNGRPKHIGEFAGAKVDVKIGFAYSLGAMLLHATGCWQFNRWLRWQARIRGWTLNQYGLYDAGSHVILQSPDESDFFEKLDCPYFEPADRDDSDFFNLT